ncbi:MAG: IclR family transcriptional regulator [Alphaproteobacteria bacterium]|nr:IclR family transcriptional regulator [Alphaproteobacteria bacterium]
MSLAKVAAILRRLARDQHDLAVGELAEAMNWPKSSASRLLKDMHQHGLLERDYGTRRYRPSLLMLQLAARYRSAEPLVEAADKALAELTRRTGQATGISVLDEQDVVVLRSRAGSQPLRVVTPPGDRGPAWATSTGRVLLARLTDEEIARRFRKFPRRPGVGGPASLEALMQRIQRIRAAGWEEAANEAMTGLGGVSVAVEDAQNGDAFALYFAFSSLHVHKQQRRELARHLREAADALARRFNAQPAATLGRAYG